MTHGRRPAGICGAALLIAARMNNFRRTVREMIYTAKVTETTLLKRLEEFSKTASAGLTVEEFRRISLEHSENPPAFEPEKHKKPGRKKRKIIELDDDGDTDTDSRRATSAALSLAGDAQLQTPANTQQQGEASCQSMPPPPIPIDPRLIAGEPPVKKRRGRPPKSQTAKSQAQAPASPPATQPVPSDVATAVEDPSALSLTQVSAFAEALESTTDPSDQPPSPPPRTHQTKPAPPNRAAAHTAKRQP